MKKLKVQNLRIFEEIWLSNLKNLIFSTWQYCSKVSISKIFTTAFRQKKKLPEKNRETIAKWPFVMRLEVFFSHPKRSFCSFFRAHLDYLAGGQSAVVKRSRNLTGYSKKNHEIREYTSRTPCHSISLVSSRSKIKRFRGVISPEFFLFAIQNFENGKF